eukprot:9730280-Lingulodinium_polyedra.AAC.1
MLPRNRAVVGRQRPTGQGEGPGRTATAQGSGAGGPPTQRRPKHRRPRASGQNSPEGPRA